MIGIALFLIGLLCLFSSRLLLMAAAFEVSVWWGLAIFLPFGPALFVQNYPEQTVRAKWVGLLALPCVVFGLCFAGEPTGNARIDGLTRSMTKHAVDWFCDTANAASEKHKAVTAGR